MAAYNVYGGPDNTQRQSKTDDEIADEVVREYERMWITRANFESHWEEIAQRMWPETRSSFNALNFRTPGEKRMQEVFDSTPILSLQRFAAIISSLLIPGNQTWQHVEASDPYINKDREVQLWFEEATRALFHYRYMENSGFDGQLNRIFLSLGGFGTGGLFTDENFSKNGFRYKSVGLGQMYIAENHQGIVDKVVRRFKLTARQAIQKFGENNVPDSIKAAMKSNPEQEYEFIHCVKPNDEREIIRADYMGMEYAEYYVALVGKKLCKRGGYNSFPYSVPRYQQADDEVYGRSPAMDALPATKTLNEMAKTVLKQGHRAVDPPFLVHDDGILDAFSIRPGAATTGGVTADGRPLVHPLQFGQVQAGKEMMDDQRGVIKDTFLVNLFQILTESPQMTATEVLERVREKGILLAPTVGRVGSELLGPMIHRELDILMLQRKLRPMPGLLREAKGAYKIVYNNDLTRAQRAQEAAGAARWLEQGVAVYNATQNPEVFDFMNLDVIMPAIADIQGVPASWKRTMADVQKIRAGRAKEAQDQKMIQAAPAAAAVAKSAAAMQQASAGQGQGAA